MMKKLYFILIFLLPVVTLLAQEEQTEYKNNNEFKTIFGGKKVGGYGCIGAGYSVVNDIPSVAFDARGGIILGHWFSLGIGGGSFVSPYEYNTAHSTDINLTGGYGGFYAEIILLPKSRVHLSFPILVGVGGAAVSTRFYTNSSSEVINNVEQTSVFTLIEPSAELEFNFTKFMRMAGFFSYRYTSSMDFDSTWEIDPGALNNYTAGIRLKFGKF
jgi:hypothetical protein